MGSPFGCIVNCILKHLVLWVRQVLHSPLSGTEIEHAFVTYDALGRPLVRDTFTMRSTYAYDALDQLVSENNLGGLTTYAYDAAYRRAVRNLSIGMRQLLWVRPIE